VEAEAEAEAKTFFSASKRKKSNSVPQGFDFAFDCERMDMDAESVHSINFKQGNPESFLQSPPKNSYRLSDEALAFATMTGQAIPQTVTAEQKQYMEQFSVYLKKKEKENVIPPGEFSL